MKTYSTRHKQVVVLTCYSSIRTILFALIGIVFIKATFVTLDIQTFTNHFNKRRYNLRLC